MKKILSAIALVAVLFVSVQYAEAEEILILEGVNEDIDIFITIEGKESLVILDAGPIYAELEDSKLKNYKSGGFSLKNVEEKIAIWGHPFSETQYKLLILTSEGISRITVDVVISSDQIVTKSDETILPKSSVGADITKHDIPTTGRTEHTPYVKPENIHDPDSLDIISSVPKKVSYKHNLNFDFTAIDTQIKSKNDQKLDGVSVFSTIYNPLGGIMETWNGTTGNKGLFSGQYYIVDNQMLGQYKIETTMKKDNYTPITKMVNFFVLPAEDSSSSKKCPSGYAMNSTNQCDVV